DENSSPNFTRHLNLSAVPIVTIGGVQYREFLLDINQMANNPLLSLDELQLFVGNANSPTGGTLDANGTLTLPGFTRIYDRDANAGGDSTIELNFHLNPGSGGGDMFAYTANSLFVGGTKMTVLTVRDPERDQRRLRGMGRQDDFDIVVVPEPATIAL